MEIKVERPLTELLQEVRYEMSTADIKKSGYNPYAKSNYFELKDFLSLATKLFYERKICPQFWIDIDSSGVEYAHLNITNGTQTLPFKLPTAEANNSSNPIQNQGSKVTYMRRYLYMMALDLVENDVVDAAEPSDKPAKEPKATEKQLELIRDLYDEENIGKMLEYYHISSLDEMTLKDASTAINRKKSK